MKRTFNRNRKKFIFIPFGIAACLALISYVVMLLWNNLLPEILHVNPITYWQAMGIFLLSKILFGFGKGGGRGWGRHQMGRRYDNMSAEDKQKFRQAMRDKMCNWARKDPDSEGEESFSTSK